MQSVFAGLSSPALLTLDTSFTVEVKLTSYCTVQQSIICSVPADGLRNDVRHRHLDTRIHTFVVVCRVATFADQELLSLALSASAQAVDASDAIWTTPVLFSAAKVKLV